MVKSQSIEEQEVTKKSKATGSDPLSPVGIRLGEDLRAAIEVEAEHRGISLGEVCRELIEEGMHDSPDRLKTELLRSLAIVEEQVKRATDQELIRRSWLSRRNPFLLALEELREELQTSKMTRKEA